MQWPITSRRAWRVAVGRGLVVAGADGGEPAGQAVGGGDEEVAAAAGRVADLQGEQGALRGRRARPP